MQDPALRFARSIVLLAPLLLSGAAHPQGTEIGFEEDFALSDDRAATLEQLIPGTADYYYYHCLQAQHEGDLDAVPPLLELWRERHGRGAAMKEIENRQALLRFGEDPAGTYRFLRQRLELTFEQERQAAGEQPDLPTRLDPDLVSFSGFAGRALELDGKSLSGFRDSALERMASGELSDQQLRELLARLKRPDLPNLPALVVRDLENERSKGFGSHGLHDALLLEQLEECVRLRPELLHEFNFVFAYLRRLQPSSDVEWRRDDAAREAYLDRLHAFAGRLSPAHNSLKAHVLYHRLRHDWKLGRPDERRFGEYLRLPREARYVNPDWLKSRPGEEQLVDFGRECPTDLAPIGGDEPLVRAYLAHFFVELDSFEPYADLVRHEYLARLFAETKILAGVGDMERWYSMLDDPAYYEQLEERVEIRFAPTRRTEYAADELVSIEVDTKNVPTLLVKVFEINTLNYHLEEQKEVDASIELDGLVASEESTYHYSESPLRRVRRHFEFPALERPGVYVVELIGNGLSSRAVIRKGRLQLIGRSSVAGHVLRVLDERGNHLREATLRLGGREYEAEEDGEIVIPFSTKPGRRQVVLCAGGRSSLAEFQHDAEEYSIEAGTFVERESLLAGRHATILVRPTLRLNGEPVSLELLEEPLLTITSFDQDEVSSTLEVRDLELSETGELSHEIVVPEGLARLSVRLRAKVRNLSRSEEQQLDSGLDIFALNGIDDSERTAWPLLGLTERGYQLDVLGKNGEPRAHEVQKIHLTHRDFTKPFEVTLKTDEDGRIELGALPGIEAVLILEAEKPIAGWDLVREARTYPRLLQGAAGRVLRVPYQGEHELLTRSVASLLELRSGTYCSDRFDRLVFSGGYLELRDLPAGDYELRLKEAGRVIAVKITAGVERDGWLVGGDRWLEAGGDAHLQIVSTEAVGEELVVQLAMAGDDARVHVFATRYLPESDPFHSLYHRGGPSPEALAVAYADSSYHSGREIGDEYRYILERRYAKKFPGNMLRRPGLLLNPWAFDDTVSGGAGGAFGGKFGGRRNLRAAGGSGSEQALKDRQTPRGFANLDFLPEPSRLLFNLEPDARGQVRVPLVELGDGQLIHAVAVDDESTVYTSLVRAEKPLVPADLRLARGLDPAKHFAEQRRLELVDTGASTTIEDVTTASVESYDSLASVFRLFATLSGNQDLVEFNFLLRWPELESEEKRELYSKYACHELHFFLHQKDRAFFDEVVRPYLANKAHRTFLDCWLLGEDLVEFLDPWAFDRLNVVERILLGRRIAGEGKAVEGHLRELLELRPSEPEAVRFHFEAALKRGALEQEKGITEELGSARASLASLDHVYKGPGDTAPPAAGRPRRAGVDEEEPEADAKLADAPGKKREGEKRQKSEDLERRDRSVDFQLWRGPASTRAYVEHNYWHRRIEEQNAELIRVNRFWLDYAAASEGEPFYSIHFPDAAGSLAEMLLALAVLDLPFEAREHVTEAEGKRFSIEAKSPLILVRKELLETELATEGTVILISQNFFRLDDRYVMVGNERRDKFVEDEFLIGVAYGCQVVLTNPTPTLHELELLLQVPEGAIPVRDGFETRGVPVRIHPYATETVEYHFYFPVPGSFPHYPVHVSRGGELLLFTPPVTLEVLSEPSSVDTESWQHVSQSGTEEQVLAFLGQANLQRLDLPRIAWRMRDRDFFESVIAELRRRHTYDHELWSFGLHHEDVRVAAEYLRHDGGLGRCGSYLDTPLLRVDPVERRAYQHVEYSPLFNGRAHRFGQRREIQNGALARQYLALLDILTYKPRLDATDWMSVTYYLLLQDRIEEALASFERVDPAGLPMALQYDYFRAYLDFFTDDHALARGIAEPYRDFPVRRWRVMFQDVLNQLDEAEGKGVATSDEENRTQRQTALAESEPQLELEVEAREVALDYRNLSTCEVSYYRMDIELLFSTSPFVQQDSGSFAYVRPNRQDVVRLPASEAQHRFELPEEFESSNVLVEVRGGGVIRRQTYFANSLSVQLIENYGQLKVTHAEGGGPLPRVYVKVFARLGDGSVRFHKDGYTDLRGRFDYASLSGDPGDAERYAILILSEEHGAVIREVAPPVE